MRAAALLLPLFVAGCDLSMRDQQRGSVQTSATLWPGGPTIQTPPSGTVAIGADQPQTPPTLDAALINRGQQRYQITCAMCHGDRGQGDGTIVQRGFPRPPSLVSAGVLQADPAAIVDVITNGRGAMYGYRDQLSPHDRWAVAAYVKVLARAGGAR